MLTHTYTPKEYPGARFWNNTHPFSDLNDEMWIKHVPLSGSTQSLEAELFLAANRLGYDYYNNGFCNNLTYAVDFIKQHGSVKDKVLDAIKLIKPYLRKEENYRAERKAFQDDFNYGMPDCLEVDFENRSIDWALDLIVEHYLSLLHEADKSGKFTPLHAGQGLYDK